MKVIAYKDYFILNKCKKIIGVYKGKTLFTGATCLIFIKNGLTHSDSSYSFLEVGDKIVKEFFYKDKYYGSACNFTSKSWKKFVKNKKREEKLNIFI